MPPLPGEEGYGTAPRRQGYVAGEILRKQENFTSHRCAPLTAPAPLPKKLDIRKRGLTQPFRGSTKSFVSEWPLNSLADYDLTVLFHAPGIRGS